MVIRKFYGTAGNILVNGYQIEPRVALRSGEERARRYRYFQPSLY